MNSHKIALIPGDGIGKAVTAAAWQVLQAAAGRGGFALEGTEFPWSCAHYRATGAMMPPVNPHRMTSFSGPMRKPGLT